ncbi:MAG: YdcF family protein [Bryobacteraceae bacterium]
MKTSRYRPSRGHKGRWLLVLCLVLLLVAGTSELWLAALGGYLVRAESPVPADMIVVLAGDFSGNRILTAGDLVRRGMAPQALISGPSGAYGLHESDLAIQFAVRHGYPQSYFVALPNDARSTRDEAADILAALNQRHAHRVDIVTSDYHTRRAGNIYHAQAPGLEIHVVASPDQYFSAGGWWKNRDGRKTFLMEWMKTIANWFGI